jgi:hypothetical protein
MPSLTAAGELPPGATIASLVAAAAAGDKPRLYFVDYWLYTSVWDEDLPADWKSGKPVIHAGRCLLYLKP